MLSKGQIYKLIDFVVAEAKDYDVRVMINSQTEGLTRFANSEIHQNTFEDVTNVTITVLDGKKRSEISTTLYSEEGLRAAVTDAITNLQFLPEGHELPPLVSEPAVIEEDGFNEDLDNAFAIDKRAKFIKEGLDTLSSEYLAYGALTYQVTHLAVGNSKGIKRFARGNNVAFSVLISDEDGGSSYAELTSNHLEDLDIAAAFKVAYEKAQMNTNPVAIEPSAYTVVLEPLAVGDILTYLSYVGFGAKSVQNKASFLTGKKGEKVFDERITIVDDFTDENTLSLPFDFEGAPRNKVNIITNGVAEGLIYDSASAMQDGVENTGHSVNMPQMGGIALNLVMAGGDKTLEEIISETEQGLLVTRFHYMNIVNPRHAMLTALTRDGVFKIENGELVGAVKNMRFTESMLEAFNNVVELSKDRQRTKLFFGNYYVPAMKIDNFHFTGKTEA